MRRGHNSSELLLDSTLNALESAQVCNLSCHTLFLNNNVIVLRSFKISFHKIRLFTLKYSYTLMFWHQPCTN